GMGADLDQVRTRLYADLGVAGGPPGRRAGLARRISRRWAPTPPAFVVRPAVPKGESVPPPRCAFCGRDLWEVERHIVAAQAGIWDECVRASHAALEAAGGAGAVPMPPRVFGRSDQHQDSDMTAIVEAVMAVFGPSSRVDDRIASIDDGEELRPRLERAER